MDRLDIPEDDETPDEVLQLADIPRPRVFQEEREGVRGELHGALVLATKFVQEVSCEERDRFPPLAKGRDADLDHIEAVVEILSELAVAEGNFEVPVGRSDDPGIRPDDLAPSHAGEFRILEHMEEFGLKAGRQLANLVQEERPFLGEFEFAQLSPIGAGERALLVAEQL